MFNNWLKIGFRGPFTVAETPHAISLLNLILDCHNICSKVTVIFYLFFSLGPKRKEWFRSNTILGAPFLELHVSLLFTHDWHSFSPGMTPNFLLALSLYPRSLHYGPSMPSLVCYKYVL